MATLTLVALHTAGVFTFTYLFRTKVTNPADLAQFDQATAVVWGACGVVTHMASKSQNITSRGLGFRVFKSPPPQSWFEMCFASQHPTVTFQVLVTKGMHPRTLLLRSRCWVQSTSRIQDLQ